MRIYTKNLESLELSIECPECEEELYFSNDYVYIKKIANFWVLKGGSCVECECNNIEVYLSKEQIDELIDSGFLEY